jgi:hypothetical protein
MIHHKIDVIILMMNKEIIMTINKYLISNEVSTSYAFKLDSRIKIISITIQKESTWEQTVINSVMLLGKVIQEKIHKQIFTDLYPYFWAKTPRDLVKNTIQRYQKLWKSQPYLLLSDIDKSEDFIHKDINGIFYSGIGLIKKDNDLKKIIDLGRKDSTLFLYLSRNINSDLKNYDSIICEKFNYVEQIINFLTRENQLFVKIDGNFDDRNLTITLFY